MLSIFMHQTRLGGRNLMEVHSGYCLEIDRSWLCGKEGWDGGIDQTEKSEAVIRKWWCPMGNGL